MQYATIWAITAIWQQIELVLVRVENEALTVTGLLSALREWFGLDGQRFTLPTEAGTVARRQFLSVLTVGERAGAELLKTIAGAQGLLEKRSSLFAEILKANDPTEVIREALDEASWLLELAGTRPLILVFDAEEAQRLGARPLASLVDVLQRALDFIGEPGTEEGTELRAAIEAALERARLLAEGAKDRQWKRRRRKRTDESGEPLVDPTRIAATGEEGADIVAGGEAGEAGEAGMEGVPEKGEDAPEKTSEGGKGKRRRRSS